MKGPIDPEVAGAMRDIGRKVDEALPPGWGFCLMVFEFGEQGNMNYISNARRDDMIKAFEEFLESVKAGEIHEGGPNKKGKH